MKPDYKLVAKAKYIHATADLASELWHEVYKRYYPAKQLDTLVEELQSADAIEADIDNDVNYFLVVLGGKTIGYFAWKMENTALHLTVRATSLLPSTEGCAAFGDFYAVDDLGNYYWSSNDPEVIYTWQTLRSLRGNFHATGLWTSEYEAFIASVDPAASWVELRYDRDGRDVRLRIDLTGGESQ